MKLHDLLGILQVSAVSVIAINRIFTINRQININNTKIAEKTLRSLFFWRFKTQKLKVSEIHHVSENAQKAAKYLREIFKEVDIPRKHARAFFRVCCEENNQITICYYIKRMMKILERALPEHFEKFAADPDIFDYYCSEILRHL